MASSSPWTPYGFLLGGAPVVPWVDELSFGSLEVLAVLGTSHGKGISRILVITQMRHTAGSTTCNTRRERPPTSEQDEGSKSVNEGKSPAFLSRQCHQDESTSTLPYVFSRRPPTQTAASTRTLHAISFARRNETKLLRPHNAAHNTRRQRITA